MTRTQIADYARDAKVSEACNVIENAARHGFTPDGDIPAELRGAAHQFRLLALYAEMLLKRTYTPEPVEQGSES